MTLASRASAASKFEETHNQHGLRGHNNLHSLSHVGVAYPLGTDATAYLTREGEIPESFAAG